MYSEYSSYSPMYSLYSPMYFLYCVAYLLDSMYCLYRNKLLSEALAMISR